MNPVTSGCGVATMLFVFISSLPFPIKAIVVAMV